MTKEQLNDLVISGEIIITTRDFIEGAVKEHCSHLYKDDDEFYKNRFRSQREFESLNEEDLKQIADDIIFYLTND